MKFDVLIEGYLKEAKIGERGYVSSEEAMANVDPQNGFSRFMSESNPKHLIYMVIASRENPDMKFRLAGKNISGAEVSKKIKELFFADPNSRFWANVPKNQDGTFYNQHQLLRYAQKNGKQWAQNPNSFGFEKTPAEYGAWGQLVTLVTTGDDVRESDIRQENESESRWITYTNVDGEKTQYRFAERPDKTITRTPFSSSVQWAKNSIRPQALASTGYKPFLRMFNQTGGTLQDLADLIGGTIGRTT
jgi:hypothetical protein